MQDKERKKILTILGKTPAMSHTDQNFYHGRLKHYPPDATPKTTWKSSQPPRMGSSSWLTASEFCDKPRILADKVQYLARLLLCSKKTVVYSGAGISTSSGVHQTAKGKTGRSKSLGYQSDAEPNITHYALSTLINQNLVQSWVQLNYDGLAQKAGCPQSAINEVHGSWYDPSNPVLKSKGMIREDLFDRMVGDSETADLVLALGTSLRGTSCDVVAQASAERSLDGRSLGTVIISLQQTSMDGVATIRIFSIIERVLKMLMKTLDIQLSIPKTPFKIINHARVPFDKNGERSETKTIYINLSPGQRVRLNANHNCRGSLQPTKSHIQGAESVGVGRVMRYSPGQMAWEMEIEGTKMLLGCWWVESAVKGLIKTLPVLNTMPMEEDISKKKEENKVGKESKEGCETKASK